MQGVWHSAIVDAAVTFIIGKSIVPILVIENTKTVMVNFMFERVCVLSEMMVSNPSFFIFQWK